MDNISLLVDTSSLHPSTRLALAALEWLEMRICPATMLDIGCGNGILSLTAAHLWNSRVLACDISPNAVADMQANIRDYAPEAAITVLRSDGLKHPSIRAQGPYDLIIANLLAQWQVQMAKSIAECLHPKGMLMLSGVLLWQEQGLLDAFKTLNIIPIQQFSENEWQCYILRHEAENPPDRL